MSNAAADDRTPAHAPDPEDPRKPDDPGDIRPPAWRYVLRRTVREFSADHCTDLAATLTYYAVLAMFPAMIAIFSLLGVVGQGRAAADAVLQIVSDVAPGDRSSSSRPRRPRASRW